ncbi:Low-affinity inorganic phosphate transporter 1 [Aedoeadaptatus ivorii]|uniref:Low-affinity inorganic phosphate transporter 1 n=1 Tax=Aedoeadaptatus ivorii TaxID=54006 RepID=A0A3S5BVY7_9FIRM|nr:inorganic phosphate transporter [Peptoniphilus ivorii]VEJ35068.1 Low-affinity inorganic phosphate transporter 1 [Peptoniphilus ivorii]
MTVSIQEFIAMISEDPAIFITALLVLAVIFVNGWTDAPNAIATAVSTRSIEPQKAIYMATLFNFLGVFVMTFLNANVAETIFNMVDFNGNNNEAVIALCAALFSIVIWATAAWYFGIPTSESHALIAGLSGSAIALHGGLAGINGAEWIKNIYGLVLSTVLGFGMGYIVVEAVKRIFFYADRRKTKRFFKNGQLISAAAMAFMHGAQDGQKFMGVFMLAISLGAGTGNAGHFIIPSWLMILTSLVIGFGTSIGGLRIIKSVGMIWSSWRPTKGSPPIWGRRSAYCSHRLPGSPSPPPTPRPRRLWAWAPPSAFVMSTGQSFGRWGWRGC